MAHMNQEKKALIAAALKKVVPAGWKYSLAVRHHSTIVMTISAAPVDLIAEMNAVLEADPYRSEHRCSYTTYADVNQYHSDRQFSASSEVIEKILAALNTGNHDRSDLQTDYFDVGWYVDLNIGRWDKPFQHLPEMKAAA